MNANIRNVSNRPMNAMIAVPIIAMLLLSLGPVTGLPEDTWATVKGTVTDINNGEPIVGAEVTISYHGIVRTDITDTSGAYEFTNVPMCYCMKTIDVSKDGYRPESKDVGVQAVTVVDFQLLFMELEPYEGTVMGTVTDVHDGEPIEGARVELEYHGTIRTVYTDTEGGYRFDQVSEGLDLMNVTARADHFRPEIKAISVEGITVVDFELMHEEMEPSEGSVSGIVTNADTGLPIEGATMTLEYHGNTQTSVTDTDGAYAFTGIPICYCMKDLSVEADGFEDQARQVAVAEGTIEDFALEPEDGGSNGLYGIVTGIVADASTNGPIAGALVTLEYHDIVRTTVTDADGRYAFQDVPICFCMKDLSVEADGYEDAHEQVAVGEETTQDFALEPVPDDGNTIIPSVPDGTPKETTGLTGSLLSKSGLVTMSIVVGISAILVLVSFLAASMLGRKDRA